MASGREGDGSRRTRGSAESADAAAPWSRLARRLLAPWSRVAHSIAFPLWFAIVDEQAVMTDRAAALAPRRMGGRRRRAGRDALSLPRSHHEHGGSPVTRRADRCRVRRAADAGRDGQERRHESSWGFASRCVNSSSGGNGSFLPGAVARSLGIPRKCPGSPRCTSCPTVLCETGSCAAWMADPPSSRPRQARPFLYSRLSRLPGLDRQETPDRSAKWLLTDA